MPISPLQLTYYWELKWGRWGYQNYALPIPTFMVELLNEKRMFWVEIETV